MLPPDRHGPLLDHMSSIALAAVLVLPPAEEIVRLVDRADTATVVGALSEMPPVRAASLVMAMDAGRVTGVLRQAAPTRVADILRDVSPVAGGRNCSQAAGKVPRPRAQVSGRMIRHVPESPGNASLLRDAGELCSAVCLAPRRR